MRKHRSDSKLWNLDEDVQRQIYELRSCGLREIIAKCESEFGFKTSLASLSTWLREKHVEMCAEARADAIRFADSVESDAAGKVDAAVQAQLGQLAFDAAMTKDPQLLRTAYGLLLERQRVGNDAGSLQLMRDKYEDQKSRNAQAAEALKSAISTKGGITPETRAKIEEALNLL
jgi:hypothetical protein